MFHVPDLGPFAYRWRLQRRNLMYLSSKTNFVEMKRSDFVHINTSRGAPADYSVYLERGEIDTRCSQALWGLFLESKPAPQMIEQVSLRYCKALRT